MSLLLLVACAFLNLDEGTAVGDECGDEGSLRCTTSGDLLECVEGEWADGVGCSCDSDGVPSCG